MAEAQKKVTIREHHQDARCPTLHVFDTVFWDAKLWRWAWHELSEPQQAKKRRIFMDATILDILYIGGMVLEAEDWAACALVVKPGQNEDSLVEIVRSGCFTHSFKVGWKACYRILGPYTSSIKTSKAKVIPKSRFHDVYYVCLIGTMPEHRNKGLMTALIEEIQARARADQKPVWLEATGHGAQKQFERVGFEVVEMVTLGKGQVGADGLAKVGGEGISFANMIWWPEDMKRWEVKA